VGVNVSKEVAWYRTDSFVSEGEQMESASEHIFLTSDGGYMSVNDQGFGIGLLKLQAYSGEYNDEESTASSASSASSVFKGKGVLSSEHVGVVGRGVLMLMKALVGGRLAVFTLVVYVAMFTLL